MIDWIIPREEFHAYLQALVRAGLAERLMFGSDQMIWPEAIERSVNAVRNAPGLTSAQKRDIFYNTAVRFFRLKEEDLKPWRESWAAQLAVELTSARHLISLLSTLSAWTEAVYFGR